MNIAANNAKPSVDIPFTNASYTDALIDIGTGRDTVQARAAIEVIRAVITASRTIPRSIARSLR